MSTPDSPVVLQVLPRLVTGGVERGTIEITRALAEAGWRPLVVSAGGPMVHQVGRAGGEHVTLPVHAKDPVTMHFNVNRLRRVIAQKKVALVHARSRAPALSAVVAARRQGVPFMTTFHGTYNLGPFGLKKPYNAVMTKGRLVIAISEFIKRHILETYQVPEARLRVVHRGVDPTLFDPEAVSPGRMIRLAQRWRLPDGARVVMLPGRLTRWKGQAVLIRALAKLARPEVHCLLVGSDQGRSAYTRELEKLAAEAGLGDRVHIIQDCDDLPAAYMLTDVVVSASTDPEAFGRVVVEGQAMGRPVIAPDHGAAPELVRPGETGWLTPPGDPEALAERLATALDLSTERRHEMARAAIEHARTHFDSALMAARTLDVYREVLAAGPTPR
ncbi:glycosyltransferase family 4 protein [Roseospirillum parvum]|nr:glycosyltransferase family 4 protein [Roseospirillum parvum]